MKHFFMMLLFFCMAINISLAMDDDSYSEHFMPDQKYSSPIKRPMIPLCLKAGGAALAFAAGLATQATVHWGLSDDVTKTTLAAGMLAGLFVGAVSCCTCQIFSTGYDRYRILRQRPIIMKNDEETDSCEPSESSYGKYQDSRLLTP
jgi:hypothetical protein